MTSFVIPEPWVAYTWNGVDGFLWQGGVFIPADFSISSAASAIFLAPPGGRAMIPPPAQGEPGPPVPPTSVTVIEVSQGSALPPTVVNVTDPLTGAWTLTFGVHSGATGPTAELEILLATDLANLTNALAGWVLSFIPGAGSNPDQVVFTPPKVGGWFYPATITSTTSANGSQRTLCQVAIAPQPWAWSPFIQGQALCSPTGTDVQVNLIARLNSTSGQQVGVALGAAGQNTSLVLSSGIPAGSATGYGQVAANTSATILLRAEQQNGSDSFTTAASATQFGVRVDPLP